MIEVNNVRRKEGKKDDGGKEWEKKREGIKDDRWKEE